MSHVSAALHDVRQNYRSLHCAAHARLLRAELPLLLAALLYKLASTLLFIPAMQQLWGLTLRFAPVHYLSNRNASDIYTSPAIVGCIVLIALLAAFWVLYGFSLLLHILDAARQDAPLRPAALAGRALADIRHALLPQNWGVLLYGVTLVPFTGFFLAWNHLTQFAVPEYLLGIVCASPASQLLCAAAVSLVLALYLYGLLVLPLFVLERKSFWQALRQSHAFVCRHARRVLYLLARWEVSAAVRAGALVLTVLAVLYTVSLGIGMVSTAGMLALSRAMLLVEQPALTFFGDLAAMLAQCMLFSLFYDCRASGTLPSAAPLPVKKALYGRRLLALALAGTTVCTAVLAVLYVALPADDTLRTMLGGAVPIVTAHRGYSSAAPENTLAAFQAAIDSGSERAELDVQMTKDGVVMVTHDTSLRRCTGRNANIYDLTYDEVRRLSAGRWFASRFAGEKIPTLEEVLALCKGKIQLNVEIKPHAATPDLERETVRILEEYGFADDCVITSQSYETLCKVKETAPEISTGYILALGVGSCYDLPAADFFSIESTFITSGMVQQIHRRGKTVSAWTINREQDAAALLKLGVDDLITDKPEMVQELLDRSVSENSRLLSLRDAIRSLFGPVEEVLGPDADEEDVIEDLLEDPEAALEEA